MNLKYLFIIQNKFIPGFGRIISVRYLEKVCNSHILNSTCNCFVDYWVAPRFHI